MITRVSASVSLACLERSVANSVHTSACIPLTIWAIAAIGLTQTRSHLGPFGVEVNLPNIPTARSHYGVAIVIFRGKTVTCYDFVETDGNVQFANVNTSRQILTTSHRRLRLR